MSKYEKLYYTSENLTESKDSSLLSPDMLRGDIIESEHYCAAKRGWQSAPSIVTTPGGRLICVCSGDNSEMPDETPNNYNFISVSDDNGESWKCVLVIDHPCSVRMHEPVLWLAPDGSLRHFWAQSYNWWDGRGGVWESVCREPDAPEPCWSEPRRIADGVMASTPIASKTGEYFYPISIWKNFPSKYNSLPSLAASNIYISRDEGNTLEYVGSAYEPDTTFDENCIAERDDGSFIMIMRTRDAIASSESFDRGKSWSRPRKILESPSSRSYLARFADGKLLLIAHSDFREEDGKGNIKPMRKNITAFVSDDGGSTWKKSILLDPRGNISYPCGMITPSGRVYVAYDRGRYDEREVYYATFTEEELLRGELSEEGSFIQKLAFSAGKERMRAGKVM